MSNTPLVKYVKIKDKFCISYYGLCKEYIVQLKNIRKKIKEKYYDIQIYLSCRDSFFEILKDEEFVVKQSDLEKEDFAYVKELKDDMKKHPVYEFLKESNIKLNFETNEFKNKEGNICFINKIGNLPTKNYNDNKIEKFIEKMGYVISNEYNYDVSCVASVESFYLFDAAFYGIKTILIPTGLGTELYKEFFPNGIIFPI